MKMKKASGYMSYCSEERCHRCLRSVGMIGLIGNIFLVLLKVFVGIAFFSTALLADSLYSVMDVGFAVLVIAGLRISAKPPDSTHDFGHGKIEFLITIIFSVLTMVGAVGLFAFAVFELHDGVLGEFSSYVLMAALISAVANYLFYRYTDCIASKFDSPSVRSLSIHSKADAISSLLVAASMGFAFWGYLYVGSFVAIIETIHILSVGAEIFRRSMGGLLDESIPPKELRDIKHVLSSIPGIRNVNYVKSRKVGHQVWLNIEIEVPSKYNIRRVDVIRGKINEMIKGKVKHLEEIMVNVVPFKEDPEEHLSFSDAGKMPVQAE